MEFVYEEERKECKEISVGEIESEKCIRKVILFGMIHLSSMKKKKKKKIVKKKCEKNKCN